MEAIRLFRALTSAQRNTFVACFLGWTLDAFDFFILIFCVNALAAQLQEEGAKSFVNSWHELMEVINSKSAALGKG